MAQQVHLQNRITRDDVINAILYREEDFLGRNRAKYINLFNDVYRELNIENIKDLKYARLSVDNLRRVQVPEDYLLYGSLNIEDRFGNLVPLVYNPTLKKEIIDLTSNTNCGCGCGCTSEICGTKSNFITTSEEVTLPLTNKTTRVIATYQNANTYNIFDSYQIDTYQGGVGFNVNLPCTNQAEATIVQNVIISQLTTFGITDVKIVYDSANNGTVTLTATSLSIGYLGVNGWSEIFAVIGGGGGRATYTTSGGVIDLNTTANATDYTSTVICNNGTVERKETKAVLISTCVSERYYSQYIISFDSATSMTSATTTDNNGTTTTNFEDLDYTTYPNITNFISALTAALNSIDDVFTVTDNEDGTITIIGDSNYASLDELVWTDQNGDNTQNNNITSLAECDAYNTTPRVTYNTFGAYEMQETITNVCQVEKKECGCLEATDENKRLLCDCGFYWVGSGYAYCNAPTYEVNEKSGMIQLPYDYPYKTVVLGYYFTPPKIDQLYVPIFAKNALIYGIKAYSEEWKDRTSQGRVREWFNKYEGAREELFRIQNGRLNIAQFKEATGTPLFPHGRTDANWLMYNYYPYSPFTPYYNPLLQY